MSSEIINKAITKSPMYWGAQLLVTAAITSAVYFFDVPKSTMILYYVIIVLMFQTYRNIVILENATLLLSDSIARNREILLEKIDDKYGRVHRENAILQERVERLEQRPLDYLFIEQIKKNLEASRKSTQS